MENDTRTRIPGHLIYEAMQKDMLKYASERFAKSTGEWVKAIGLPLEELKNCDILKSADEKVIELWYGDRLVIKSIIDNYALTTERHWKDPDA